jgi:hypothetical protein
MRTARLDYRPGTLPAPVGFHKPKQDIAPAPVRKAPTKATPEHKPVEMDADTRSRLRDLLEVLGAQQTAQALRTSTTHIMDWWTGRRPIPETMPATIRKVHKLIIGDDGL